jgi:hypothetical protein
VKEASFSEKTSTGIIKRSRIDDEDENNDENDNKGDEIVEENC